MENGQDVRAAGEITHKRGRYEGSKASYRLVIPLALLAIAVVMAITNPSADEHKKAILSAAAHQAQEESEGKAGMAMLAVGTIKLADMLGATLFDYETYLVFSVVRVDDEVMSFGLLGNVFVND